MRLLPLLLLICACGDRKDADGDGYRDAASGGTDCDDGDATVHPGAAEVCDGRDQDCDGVADGPDATGARLLYRDRDGDGYGDPATSDRTCGAPSGWVANDLDCDDQDPEVQIAPSWYEDADGDGVGDDTRSVAACTRPDGHVASAGDCDDADADIHPLATEECGDGVDQDCDGEAPGCTTLDLAGLAVHVSGSLPGDYLGADLVAGDLDGDGVADLLLGAPGAQGERGMVYLFRGPLAEAKAAAAAGQQFVGLREGDRLGESLAVADLDGDGVADWASGARGSDAVYVSVSTGIHRLGSPASDVAAGVGIAGAGDVDGDGVDDLLVGANLWDGSEDDVGAAWLVSGPVESDASLEDATAMLIGERRWSNAGRSVAGAGDVDGDGYADIVVGAYGYTGEHTFSGAAYLLYGPVEGTVSLGDADARITGTTDQQFLGQPVAGVGDVDGDGRDDLAVGAAVAADGGHLFVVHGAITGEVSADAADLRISGDGGLDAAGFAIAAAGDLDGDGGTDVVVGGPYDADGGLDAGAAWVIDASGTGTASLGEARVKLIGATPFAATGWAVAPAGDQDGDGIPDLLIGSPLWPAEEGSGAAWVVPGGGW